MPLPPHMSPQHGRPHLDGTSLAIRLVVAATVALVLAGYTLALGFTGVPVIAAAIGGMIAGLVLLQALTG